MAAEDQSKKRSRVREVRALSTDERASFLIMSLYMLAFCMSAFVYWDLQVLRILGVTAAAAGLFLFYAAFFNTEGLDREGSYHPLRTYLVSFFVMLLSLFVLRLAGGLIENPRASVITLYTGLVLALIVFRKALVQVISMMVLCVFVFVTAHNWDRALGGEMTFRDALQQCGQALFRIGPIEDVANMLIAGNYLHYLNKVDYRDEQINILATKQVLDAVDDEYRKTKALLDFVSNEIRYVSDPEDGMEYAKKPISTLIAGGGDCEDQTLVLCSLMESVGLKTYIAFTDDHVFALVRFSKPYKNLGAQPYVYIDGAACYALDAADPGAQIGYSLSKPVEIHRIFDVRNKALVHFELTPEL